MSSTKQSDVYKQSHVLYKVYILHAFHSPPLARWRLCLFYTTNTGIIFVLIISLTFRLVLKYA